MRSRRHEGGEIRSSTLVVFGGGALDNPDGSRDMSTSSEQRARHALNIYHKNPEQLRRIILTGGAGLTAVGMKLPPNKRWCEANLMADYLIRNDVPHRLIEREDESTSTIDNIANILELGLVVPHELSPENPLGAVSNRYHLERISDTFRALGVDGNNIEKFPAPERDSCLRELTHRALNQVILFGVDSITGTDDAETLQLRIGTLRRRDKALAETLTDLRKHRLPAILRPFRA